MRSAKRLLLAYAYSSSNFFFRRNKNNNSNDRWLALSSRFFFFSSFLLFPLSISLSSLFFSLLLFYSYTQLFVSDGFAANRHRDYRLFFSFSFVFSLSLLPDVVVHESEFLTNHIAPLSRSSPGRE